MLLSTSGPLEFTVRIMWADIMAIYYSRPEHFNYPNTLRSHIVIINNFLGKLDIYLRLAHQSILDRDSSSLVIGVPVP